MAPNRVQLHSSLGQRLLWALSASFWLFAADVVFVCALSVYRRHFGVANILIPLWTVGMFFVSRWSRRNATPVFATPAGLELSGAGCVVPWRCVTKAEYLPLLSSLMPVYRVSFADDRRPLTFYACEDVERVVQRFKAGSESAS